MYLNSDKERRIVEKNKLNKIRKKIKEKQQLNFSGQIHERIERFKKICFLFYLTKFKNFCYSSYLSHMFFSFTVLPAPCSSTWSLSLISVLLTLWCYCCCCCCCCHQYSDGNRVRKWKPREILIASLWLMMLSDMIFLLIKCKIYVRKNRQRQMKEEKGI